MDRKLVHDARHDVGFLAKPEPLAVFVKDALERRFSFAQLARMVGPLIAASRATWVSEEVAKGRTIESLIQELARLPPEHA